MEKHLLQLHAFTKINLLIDTYVSAVAIVIFSSSFSSKMCTIKCICHCLSDQNETVIGLLM